MFSQARDILRQSSRCLAPPDDMPQVSGPPQSDTAHPQRMKVFQYWDSGQPPPEIAALVSTWAQDIRLDHRLFNRDDALTMIRQHAGKPLLAAFEVCASGAMQADLFRLFCLYLHGGLYVDADLGNRGGLDRFVQIAPEGMLASLAGGINNDIIYVRQPRSPLLRLLLNRAVTRISRRDDVSIAQLAGPGLWHETFTKAKFHPLFEGWLVEDRLSILRYVHMPLEMDYKTREGDWRVDRKLGKSPYRIAP
jgi:mannosyltransferase OCH1-like enzyme